MLLENFELYRASDFTDDALSIAWDTYQSTGDYAIVASPDYVTVGVQSCRCGPTGSDIMPRTSRARLSTQVSSLAATTRADCGFFVAITGTITDTLDSAGTLPGVMLESLAALPDNTVRLLFADDGSIIVTQGAGVSSDAGLTNYGTVLGQTAAGVIPKETIKHVSLKQSTGGTQTLTVRVDGVSVGVYNTITPLPSGETKVVSIGDTSAYVGALATDTQYGTMYLDNFIVPTDGYASGANGYVEPTDIVYNLLPSADGVPADWTPSTPAAPLFSMINSLPADTDYIYAPNVGDIAALTYDAIPVVTGDIIGITVGRRATRAGLGGTTVEQSGTLPDGTPFTSGPVLWPAAIDWNISTVFASWTAPQALPWTPSIQFERTA